MEKIKFPDGHYTVAIAAAGVLLADAIYKLETNASRKEKMCAVIKKKKNLFDETFSSQRLDVEWVFEFGNIIRNSVAKHEAITFLIDLIFSNPFAPYELDFKPKAFHAAVKTIGALIGVGPDRVDQIILSQTEAFKAHRRFNYGTIAGISIAGLAAIATGAWFAAPYIGALIGTAAGLSGAAATAHGLAILGGGSLAIGGFGMAGGTWLIVGSSVLIAGASGGATLLAIGSAAAKIELVKLQVTFKEVILVDPKRAHDAIESLRSHQKEIEATLEQECCLNEKSARRVKDIDQTLHAIIKSVDWMEKKLLAH